MKSALVYLLAIIIAEAITVTNEPVWGIAFHIVILASVTLHSALSKEQSQQQLLLALVLVPLVRIISLSMPLDYMDTGSFEGSINLPSLF